MAVSTNTSTTANLRRKRTRYVSMCDHDCICKPLGQQCRLSKAPSTTICHYGPNNGVSFSLQWVSSRVPSKTFKLKEKRMNVLRNGLCLLVQFTAICVEFVTLFVIWGDPVALSKTSEPTRSFVPQIRVLKRSISCCVIQ